MNGKNVSYYQIDAGLTSDGYGPVDFTGASYVSGADPRDVLVKPFFI